MIKIPMTLEFSHGYVVISDLYAEQGLPIIYISILKGQWIYYTDNKHNRFHLCHQDYLPTPCGKHSSFTIFTASSKLKIVNDEDDQGIIFKCPEGAGFYNVYTSTINMIDGLIRRPVVTAITINLKKPCKYRDNDHLKGLEPFNMKIEDYQGYVNLDMIPL